MLPRDAAVLASRILALFFAVQAITGLTHWIVILTDTGSGLQWRIFVVYLVQAAIAFALWSSAERLGNAMARGTTAEVGQGLRPLNHLRGLGMFIVGLVFAVTGTVEFAQTLIGRSDGFGFGSPAASTGGAIAIAFVKFGIGAALMAYGNSLVARTPQTSTPDG